MWKFDRLSILLKHILRKVLTQDLTSIIVKHSYDMTLYLRRRQSKAILYVRKAHGIQLSLTEPITILL
jgi:hypothetical protein